VSERRDVLRVVQLNIGSLLEPDWESRRHEIVAWIDELQPDVACFQEAWEAPGRPNSAGWIADALQEPMEWIFGGHSFGGPCGHDDTLLFGSAMLSRFPIDGVELHRLPVAGATDVTAEIPGVLASDHRGLVVDIVWPTKPEVTR